MRYYLRLFLSALLFNIIFLATAKSEESDISIKNSELLSVSISCKNNNECIYTPGERLYIEINVMNVSQEDILFPLAYIRKTGPSIKLTDNTTDNNSQLRTNLANRDLLQDFTIIPPGETVSIPWVIFTSELEQFKQLNVDVSAKVVIFTEVKVKNKMFLINESATIKIREKNE